MLGYSVGCGIYMIRHGSSTTFDICPSRKGANNVTSDEAKQLAKKRLSAKRYHHTKNVVKAARELACRFGADPEKAALAAWLHDIVKEDSQAGLLRELSQDAIIARSVEARPPAVWHGPAAAVYARNQLGVQDEEVLSAIACHTTGKPGMSKLDKILFVADVVDADRDFEGVGEIRRLAKKNLDAAVLAALKASVQYLRKMGKPLDGETLAALQDMEKEAGTAAQAAASAL